MSTSGRARFIAKSGVQQDTTSPHEVVARSASGGVVPSVRRA